MRCGMGQVGKAYGYNRGRGMLPPPGPKKAAAGWDEDQPC